MKSTHAFYDVPKNKLDKSKQELISLLEMNNRELEYLNSLEKVLASDDGKRVLKNILGFCQPLENPFDNSGHTAFNLGKQDVAKYIISSCLKAGADLKFTFCLSDGASDMLLTTKKAIKKQNEEIILKLENGGKR